MTDDDLNLPEFVFFTGAPGSRWSGVAQVLEQHPRFDTSDRSAKRVYRHSEFSGHLGAYFGPGMEFEAKLDRDYLASAWVANAGGCRIVKSHHWAYMLDDLRHRFPEDWIMLVWRDDDTCDQWWHQAGGFSIRYPSYAWYENDEKMRLEIARQNRAIKEFAAKNGLTLSVFDQQWVEDNFGFRPEVSGRFDDVFVAICKAS